jgi:DNA polymerase-3 subunit gamma/tau
MSLYQKVRPVSFDDMLGNEATICSLKSALESENVPHVFLFTGEAGCGKTTAARICAKMVGAEELGIVEINSSNNRGIETARTIQDEAGMMPMSGKAKASILDEAHNTTSVFQSAMLKILEDPPDYVFFFICTTNPEKLSKPFKSRCTPFQFNPIEDAELMRLLRQTNRAENTDVSRTVMEKIVEVSEGSSRKALVLLEKCLTISEEDALKALETNVDSDDPQTIDLCRGLIDDRVNWAGIIKILSSMKTAGVDPESVRYAVMGYMTAVLLNGDNRKAATCIDYFSEPFYNTGFPGLVLACYKTLFV